MYKQEETETTPEEKVTHHARVWRACDKAAIGSSCRKAKSAEYLARQQLRQAVDMLEQKAGAP